MADGVTFAVDAVTEPVLLVGAFLIDFINSLLVTGLMNFLAK